MASTPLKRSFKGTFLLPFATHFRDVTRSDGTTRCTEGVTTPKGKGRKQREERRPRGAQTMLKIRSPLITTNFIRLLLVRKVPLMHICQIANMIRFKCDQFGILIRILKRFYCEHSKFKSRVSDYQ